MRIIGAIGGVLLFGSVALAEEPSITGQGQVDEAPLAFVEASGGYGFQFGEQEYLPKEDGTSFKHPLTNGYAVGVTAGWEFIRELALIGNWEYAKSTSRSGSVTNALDEVEGAIDYHTIAVGLRWARAIGPGRLFGELGAGIVLPFETEVRYTYAGAMGGLPTPITGEGTKVDEYNLGAGAYGQLGYQWNVTRELYIASSLRVKSFQSNNDGQETRFDNFVTNFAAPRPMDMTIEYDADGPQPPHTYSVQDLRVQIAFGFRLF
jgi:hypothetical protein